MERKPRVASKCVRTVGLLARECIAKLKLFFNYYNLQRCNILENIS